MRDLQVKNVAYDCRAEQGRSLVPDLKRVAIISMPLRDINKDSHELFNKTLVSGLELAVDHAEKDGFDKRPPPNQTQRRKDSQRNDSSASLLGAEESSTTPLGEESAVKIREVTKGISQSL